MVRARKKLGEILVDLKVLQQEDVKRVLDALSRRADRLKFGQMALSMGLLREEHVLVALAVQMDLLPGIEQMSLPEILKALQSSDPLPSDAPSA